MYSFPNAHTAEIKGRKKNCSCKCVVVIFFLLADYKLLKKNMNQRIKEKDVQCGQGI